MQVKFLKQVVEDTAGKPAVEIVSLLFEKKDVNEFLIAKKLNLTINQTRNILYKLSDNGIVSFIRKKDKRKGWYIYFWTINTLKSLIFLEKRLLKEKENLENQFKNRKQKRYYFCETCKMELGEETALTNQFTCSECGEVYVLSDNKKFLDELESRISKINRMIEMIEVEKKKLQAKEEKSVKRKAARENLKKAKIRKANRERKKAEKNSIENKKSKKTALKSRKSKKISKKPKKVVKKTKKSSSAKKKQIRRKK